MKIKGICYDDETGLHFVIQGCNKVHFYSQEVVDKIFINKPTDVEIKNSLEEDIALWDDVNNNLDLDTHHELVEKYTYEIDLVESIKHFLGVK